MTKKTLSLSDEIEEYTKDYLKHYDLCIKNSATKKIKSEWEFGKSGFEHAIWKIKLLNKKAIKRAEERLKKESKKIKICDKIYVKGKKIKLSEDLCSVKDVEVFLGKIDKIFKEELGGKLTK